MAKKIDLSTSDGMKAWLQAAGFSSDKEASIALNVPFRTFCRYKSEGIATGTATAQRAAHQLVQQMQEILENRKTKA